MIKKVQRLSDLPVLYNLLAGAKTIVASGRSNYKVDIDLLKGKKIIGIEELGTPDDNINQIKLNFDTNEYQYLYFRNGTQGEKGDKGDKGPDGEKGESFNRGQVLSRAQDVLVIANDDETNDPNAVWSAYRGKLIEDFLKSVAEVFMTDEEYQLRFNEQVFIDLEVRTKNANQNSIIIYNDNVTHKTYVKYWTYEGEGEEKYFYYDAATDGYIETSGTFDIWKDFYLSDTETEYYTRHLVTTVINQDTGESTSEWVYDKLSKPIWMDLEFETNEEDRKSLLIYSDQELGDDGVVDKDPQEEEIVITHRPIVSITVDNPNFKLPINEIITKAVNITPTDYMNSPICIEYDEDMIRVFEDGRIMALETPGETTVKIYSEEDPTIFAVININVVIPVIDIQFDTNMIKAFKGYTQQIHATVLPENATNPEINWVSSDPEIAEVDETGLVTLIKEGNVTIYATSTDGTDITARIDVTVDTAVNDITINNTTKAIFGIVGTTININDLNDILNMELVNDNSVITLSNDNLSYNARTKNIKFESIGISNIVISNDNVDNIINVIVDTINNDVFVKDNTKEVLVGHSTTITADVLPDIASNKQLKWTPIIPSSAISIGNDTNGKDAKVYLSSPGIFEVEVTSRDGSDIKEYITIIGKSPITSIELDKSVLSLDLGETYQLSTTINDNADDKKIIWTSSAPNIISVDENGLVTSILGGDAVITATAHDGSGVFARCNVSSVVLITDITINNGDDIDIYAGNEYMIGYKIMPENAYNQTLIWYVSDESIATVNNGKLLAIKEGYIKVYAMADDNSGIITSINVNISMPINELILSDIELSLQVNETYSLIASVIPDEATTQKLQYISVDPTIASVDIDGNITALKAGETEIFVTTIDGTNLSQKCTINITD